NDLAFASGNGCTTISYRPDSFVSYAIQRPSGDNCALPSSNGVFTTGCGFGLLSATGRAHKSRPVFGSFSIYKRNRPSFDQSCNHFVAGVSSNSFSVPAPVDGRTNMLVPPPVRPAALCLFQPTNAISIPSGDQSGVSSVAAPKLNRVSPPRTT